MDPAPPEPAANSPADIGYLDQEQFAGGVVMAAPRPAPKLCSSCSAPIFWAQTVDEDGRRVWNPERKRFRSMPVDAQPNPDGNVVLFARPGEGVVCRVLRQGEAPPAGAKLRTSHFATCKFAARHRRRGGERG